MQDQVIDILSTILASICVLALIIYLIFALIYIIKTENMRQEHIKTLNEHDKAVVLDYKNTFWSLTKRTKDKNGKKSMDSKNENH